MKMIEISVTMRWLRRDAMILGELPPSKHETQR